jgi:transposase
MPRPLRLALRADEHAALVAARDHHPKAYVRERAAAILKVAAGHSVRWVAQVGGLKPREPEAVSGWIRRFRQDGIAGLLVRPGRGRKPAFSPSARALSQRQRRARRRGGAAAS